MIVFDIETEPGAIEIIEAAMPEEMRNPSMPDEIKTPVKPDFKEKMPDYGFTKATEAVKTAKEPVKIGKADLDLRAALEKQKSYLADKEKSWQEKANKAQTDWQAKQIEARNKFIRDAALDARTGFARMAVLNDTLSGDKTVFLFETDAEKIKLLTDEPSFEAKRVSINFYATEPAMIKAFIAELQRTMEAERALEGNTRAVGYYIKQFDLPFLFRRLWINGVAMPNPFMRGRNWSDEICDIHEVFAFYERGYGVGGLDGLAATLKCDKRKTGSGESFREWYDRNPVEGVWYGVNDGDVTQECAEKMGVGQ